MTCDNMRAFLFEYMSTANPHYEPGAAVRLQQRIAIQVQRLLYVKKDTQTHIYIERERATFVENE